MTAQQLTAPPARVLKTRVALPKGTAYRLAPAGTTVVALAAIMVACGAIQPNVWSVDGLSLVFSSIVPLVLAALAQMVMMSIGDIDLSIGAFVGLVTAVSATLLATSPLLGLLVLVGLVAGYAVLGALVQLRGVPSLVATLGASFIWLGIGLFLLPTPGGIAPGWLSDYSLWSLPLIPVPVFVAVVLTAGVWALTQRTGTGVKFRALGSNPTALLRGGSSTLAVRVGAYTAVGVLGVLAGLSLTSQIGGGDPNSANGYTMISVAAVILGGGTFSGGRAVAWGTLFGAATLGMLTVLLSLLNLSSNIQPAIQGLIVIAALAGRRLVERIAK
ncbi:ABC transporter permease [Sinomonas terrae]|uniref:ABC transporter permease n=1 Tax=Sinomonas terrae TaxID=2908838 RepID=A0ABS9U046_9MICC|nr:ABC transporter permease [Sinomonas terrae]MCH6470062.1 ABC transporter permease [Sinomonas terrae]